MENFDRSQEYVRLLTQYQGDIRAFIISLVPGSPDVSDILQETNLVLWNKRDHFEPDTNFIAWAFRIAQIEVHKLRTKMRKEKQVLFSDEVIEFLGESKEPRPIHESYLNALEICIRKLDHKQQELIRSRYTSGRSIAKLAEATGENAGALRIALMRIRQALKTCIEKQEVGGVA